MAEALHALTDRPLFRYPCSRVLNPPLVSSRALHLMIVAADATLRLRLQSDLQPFLDVQIVAEAPTTAAALRSLTGWQRGAGIDLILLELAIAADPAPPDGTALKFCQQLTAQAPDLPIVLLAALGHPDLTAAFHQGIAGCYIRGRSVSDLITTVRRVAAGQRYWPPEVFPAAVSISQRVPLINSDALNSAPTTWSNLRRQARLQGLDQIDFALMQTAVRLRSPLTRVDRWFLQGRQRELRTARWMVQKLLAAPPGPLPTSSRSEPLASLVDSAPVDAAALPALMVPRDRGSAWPAQVFDRITAKLQDPLENGTDIPLEIDFFKAPKKRQLFYAVLRQFEQLLNELRGAQVPLEQLQTQRSVLLQDLWQATIIQFFGKYYAIRVNQQSVNVVTQLLQSQETVQAEILDQIPLVPELLSYLLWQTPLMIDEVVQAAGTNLADDRATALVENLMIQVACAVVQPLLNEFSDHDSLKQDFYDRRLLSTRDIERLRNDLSWKYRITRYVNNPKAMFESRYWLWVLTDLGLQRTAIYAPRGHELDQLGGVQLTVTLLLETRDAIAPRLAATVSWLGRGLVYLLTEIIGRSIGLIGRGIVKGIGDVWHDRQR